MSTEFASLADLVEMIEIEDAPQPLAPQYASVEDFAQGHLAQVYARQINDTHELSWCPAWWEHPEAYHRISALWHAFEDLRAAGGQAWESTWWLDHADPHMQRLFDPSGTFKYCSARHGHKPMFGPLPMVSAPARQSAA